MDLQGRWAFKLDVRGNGVEEGYPTALFAEEVVLPGTTDTNAKGYPNLRRDETTNLSRTHTYAGKAWYKREVDIPAEWGGKAVILSMERTKPTRVWVDGKDAGCNDNISTCQVYDLTRFLAPGRHEIAVMVDNGGGFPPELLAASHAFAEATQTNWNGILGEIFLEARNRLHIEDVRVSPDAEKRLVRVKVRVAGADQMAPDTWLEAAAEAWNTSDAHRPVPRRWQLEKGKAEYEFDYPLGSEAQLWSEYHPVLYRLDLALGESDRVSVDFGLRNFAVRGRQFAVNGMPVFLRGKHDACVFPLTGHTPMDVASWRRYFQVVKAYGFNHCRFHSWCPPEACFKAADLEGIYLQAELPYWGWLSKDNTGLVSFLRKEGKHILRSYANHASFVMFALGNELSGDFEVMQCLVDTFRHCDHRPLYAYGSNNYLGFRGHLPGEDYLVTCRVGGETPDGFDTHVRSTFSFADAHEGGILNHDYPNTMRDFSGALGGLSVPVVSHETGQFQMFPDFRETAKYSGVLRPYNMDVFRERLSRAGMADQAADFFRASGLWAVELYKADIEMELRTGELAGFQMLDLQDYPGQGSAYVGVLDAFMDSKGLVTPERWRGFCSDLVPLALMEKYCWTEGETLEACVKVANYSADALRGETLTWTLKGVHGDEVCRGSLPLREVGRGLHEVGRISIPVTTGQKAVRLELELVLEDAGRRNTYPVWFYPDNQAPAVPQDVVVTTRMDEAARTVLEDGGKVLWFPDREDYKDLTVGGLFTTDYWNYRMFETISRNNRKPVSPGTLGILVDPMHPLFEDFPTDIHTNWQWFSIVKHGYPLILDHFPEGYRPLVQVIDNVERNHKLGLVFEMAVENGRLLVCMADLGEAMDKVEVRQFYRSLLRYMDSEAFNPASKVSWDEWLGLLRATGKAAPLRDLNNISYK